MHGLGTYSHELLHVPPVATSLQAGHQQSTGSPQHLLRTVLSASNAPGQALEGTGQFDAGSEPLSSLLEQKPRSLERLAKPQLLLYNIHSSLFSRKISKATTQGFLGQEIHSQHLQFL